MPINLKCGACGQRLKAKDDTAGKQAKCPKCGYSFLIPTMPESGSPPPPSSIASPAGKLEASQEGAGTTTLGSYAVILSESNMADKETIRTLADVLTRTMGMVKFDAVRTVKQAHGILLSNLDAETAQRVAVAIEARGQKAGFADAGAVESFGRPRVIHSGRCDEKAFQAQISHSATTDFPWSALHMVSIVLHHEPDRSIKITRPEAVGRRYFRTMFRMQLAFGVIGAELLDRPLGIRDSIREKMTLKIKRGGEKTYIADIFISKLPMALRIKSNSFNYSYLGDRLETRSELNFHSLIGDIAQWGKNVCFSPMARRFLEGDLLLDCVVSDLHEFDAYNRWLSLAAAAF